jgi:hypothetical protein
LMFDKMNRLQITHRSSRQHTGGKNTSLNHLRTKAATIMVTLLLVVFALLLTKETMHLRLLPSVTPVFTLPCCVGGPQGEVIS